MVYVLSWLYLWLEFGMVYVVQQDKQDTSLSKIS